MFGSVCWDGNISKFDRGWLEKIVRKKQVMLWECHWTVSRQSMKKRLFKKLMQILNDPTHPMRHYFDSRRSKWSGRFLLPKQIQFVIRPCSYSRLCQFLMKIIIVINLVCTCIKTAEDDNFQSLSKGERERATQRERVCVLQLWIIKMLCMYNSIFGCALLWDRTAKLISRRDE